MSQRSAYVIGLSAFATLVAACGISTGWLSSGHDVTASRLSSMSAVWVMCDPAELRLGYGSPPSMETGEYGVLYTLRNQESHSCVLVGYPAVTLFDAGGAALPFHYVDGRGQYITNAPPIPVTLPPGARAYFFVAKYRCDTGNLAAVTTIRIALPGSGAAVTGPAWVDRPGALTLSYCRGGPNDPGQFIGVSPFEPTAQAATAWPSGGTSSTSR